MAKVHDALKRIERERQRQVLLTSVPSRPVGQGGRLSWKRWFVRRPRPAQPQNFTNAMSPERMEPVAARLDILEKQLSGTHPNRSDAALLERMELIAGKLDLLEERVSHSLPSADQLRHELEAQLATLERQLVTELSGVTDRLSEWTALLSTRITVLLVLIALTLLGILFRR
jgi:hypothetical protein